MSVYLQIDASVTGLGGEFDRVSGTLAPVAYPRCEGPYGIRCLKERYECGGIRANRHHCIKGGSAEDTHRKCQLRALKLAHGVKGNRHDHALGYIVHTAIVTTFGNQRIPMPWI